MRDFGRSDDPRVQAQLDRLAALSLPQGRLGLDTARELLARLGNPHKRLPPVFHVAGTNGKGSVCAFLRAMLEADGKRVHVTTSPHLVRYNERIRLAGRLIEDGPLAEFLEEVLDAAEGLNPSFFETTIAAAFLAFSRTPADACVVEVGLGGRFDATNVLEPDVLAACGIAALGIDHERFLLAPEDGVPKDPIARIAFEKAGIIKPGVPFVCLKQDPKAERAIERRVREVEPAVWYTDWYMQKKQGALHYRSKFGSVLDLPRPGLSGTHQVENAGLAIAMLQVSGLGISEDAIRKGLQNANWPARLQQLGEGPLTRGVGVPVLLDGAHNAQSAAVLAQSTGDGPLVIISGILKNRDPACIFAPFKGRVTRFCAVPVPGHEHHDPKDLCRLANDIFALSGSYPCDGVTQAFDWLRNDPPRANERVLIAGSLYLAGEVLRLNAELPE